MTTTKVTGISLITLAVAPVFLGIRSHVSWVSSSKQDGNDAYQLGSPVPVQCK